MFKNLDAEQARRKMSNSEVAKILGISRCTYESKKKTGNFSLVQVKALLLLFDCSFDYLFENDPTTKSA